LANTEIVQIQVRRGPESQLPILTEGEPGFTTDSHKAFIGDGTANHQLAMQTDLDVTNANITENSNIIGLNSGSLTTTADGNGNLTQTVEKDMSGNTLVTTNITYNPDGTVHTVSEIINGKTYVTTLNYTNGALTLSNPFTRTVNG
jgi:hypothetical protein